ncbi:tyrosine-type recombinase/integrase [Staphylococcus carnosus]|uniref:Integrase n=1 Tax=Staphylococcus carnosus TaxID=1281 RepID=A0AAJ0JPS6_STACA|nr:tyrosine-type recombinase/integrase [Staphylococcus carnosus]KKB25774.1 integrase [Staphylococcus carnosus]POA05432.1 integrase [Staphylococcus carnosus]QQS84298.1 tyrosine-type recombinase/integrase [Staphylococcus carnosus]QRQ04239.1 tyrosine-type recombinase/integrase [Staphylococcus carnosus]UTB83762.1 integrase [Staphylococcus carnosus]
MECVLPIKDKAQIEAMYRVLKQHSQRDYLLLSFAIHTGVRLSTLLGLRVVDILKPEYKESDNQTLQSIAPRMIIESWTNPQFPEIVVPLSDSLRQTLTEYIADNEYRVQDFLFQSSRTKKQLSRQQAYRIIHKAAEEIELAHIGLQSLRKTFAYHAYKAGTPITVIQKYLGHQSLAETIRFIDIPSVSKTIEIHLDI